MKGLLRRLSKIWPQGAAKGLNPVTFQAHESMWRISIILNTIFLLVCCFFSAFPYSILRNRFVDYHSSGAKPLPW
jgi:hypothetical protein